MPISPTINSVAMEKEADDGFCPDPLWDADLTWNTDDPDFTICFHQTVIQPLSTLTATVAKSAKFHIFVFCCVLLLVPYLWAHLQSKFAE